MASKSDVARMKAIIDRCRLWGVEVVEVNGWQTRGADWARVPTGLTDHHDASSRKSGEWGALGIITTGRTGIPGPLSQFQGARCLDGKPRIAVVAAGRANHAGQGGPLRSIPANAGNSYMYGVEWANDGISEPFTDAAHYAHDALFRAVSEVCKFPVAAVVGHKEWAPSRKSDPKYAMAWRRDRVARFVPKGAPAAPPPAPSLNVPLKEDEMYIKIKRNGVEETAILSGPIFIGLGSKGEIDSANYAISKGATVQWVEPFTWDALNRMSHAVCDSPRLVALPPTPPAAGKA